MALQFTLTEPNNDRTRHFRSNLEFCFFTFPSKHLSAADNLLWIIKESSTKIGVGKACRESYHTLPHEVNYPKLEDLNCRPQLFTTLKPSGKKEDFPSNQQQA